MSSSRIPLVSLSVSLGLGLISAAPPAHAGKKECAASYVEAQKLKQAGSFMKARDQLLVCAADECLAAVKKDCVAWLDEVNAALPSIVIDARGPDGRETFDVKVSIDGEVVREKLDVKAIELDPGTHKLVFEHEGAEPIEQELTVRQGQKNKVVEVSFAPTSAPKAPEPEPEPEPGPEPVPEKAGPPTLAYVLGGVGVLALGGAGYFWLSSESKKEDLEGSGCEPRCEQGKVDDIEQARLFGDIALGVGVALLGTATYLWLTGDKGAKKEASALDVRLGPNGAYATVQRRF